MGKRDLLKCYYDQIFAPWIFRCITDFHKRLKMLFIISDYKYLHWRTWQFSASGKYNLYVSKYEMQNSPLGQWNLSELWIHWKKLFKRLHASPSHYLSTRDLTCHIYLEARFKYGYWLESVDFALSTTSRHFLVESSQIWSRIGGTNKILDQSSSWWTSP